MNGHVERAGRGVAVAALGVVAVVTVAWWTLALYPVTAGPPDWLVRTRAACFGTTGSGLPNAGGWILLIGEPLGMVAVLGTVWGDALRRDLRWMAGQTWGRGVLVASLLGLVASATLAAGRVNTALATERIPAVTIPASQIAQADRGPPLELRLQDQHGESFTLASLRGTPAIVTFAYGHCETVCPTIVREVRVMRSRSGRSSLPILVVTVDPWRDVSERLPHLASMWGMESHDRVLGGQVDDVLAALATWGINIRRDPTTGDVSHPASVIVVDSEGRLAGRMEGDLSRLEGMLRTIQ
jgi:protein SCO1/2